MKPIAGEVLFRVVRPGTMIRWPKKRTPPLGLFADEGERQEPPAGSIDREAIVSGDRPAARKTNRVIR